jgi:virginiamycin A acetyltransferase
VVNHDHLIIGKFCSIAHGTKFLLNGSNHTLKSISSDPFAIMDKEWNLGIPVTDAWDNHGDIVIGNDVWIGFEAVILSGVKIGDGAIIATRAVVKKDVEPYTIVGGVPAREIRKRFSPEQIDFLLKLKWWDWDHEKIRKNLDAILHSDFERLKNPA